MFYTNTNLGNILYEVYVDIVITRSDSKGIGNLKIFLQYQFQTKELGALKYFLDIEVMYSKKGIFLSQRKYVSNLLNDNGLLGTKPGETCMEPWVKLTIDGDKNC